MRGGLLCLVLLLGVDAEAVQPLSRSEQAVINFGFATQLGSGVYSMSGRTLQVYNLPFSWELPERPESRVQWRLTLPVTFGFLDFKPVDVLASGLPDHLDSFAFVPGIEADVRAGEDWMVQPFLQAGIARDRTSELDQRVYALGVRSYYEFGEGVARWQQFGELVHVLVDQVSSDTRDDFTRLRAGLTARRPFDASGTGRRADVLGYGFIDLYTDAPAGPATARGDSGSPPQYEVGFTFGATEDLHLWKIPIPRVGFGYRFGDGLHVYRLVLGSPY